VNEVNKVLNENKLAMRESKATAGGLADLLRMVEEGAITAASAKEVLAEMILKGGSPGDIGNTLTRAEMGDGDTLETTVSNLKNLYFGADTNSTFFEMIVEL